MNPAGGTDFDVIVVGAGVAGSVAALQLARAGHSVVLIERGEAPGAKNLSGGVLYCRPLLDVLPDLLTHAPLERRITRHHVQVLTGTSSVGLDYADRRLADPVNAVTVLRARFDPWLADRCSDAGVFVMSGVRVDGLLTQGRRIVGVRAGTDELRAHVVVAADGVNSFLAKEAGLRRRDPAKHLGLGVKAVVRLPRDVLEQRFTLAGDEGAAYTMVGDCTRSVAGGGFLYTNTESLSVGVVLRLDALTRTGAAAADVFDHFLEHPYVAPLVAGGELVEYGSHLVAEGGLAMMGELAADGLVVVGEAAGLALNTGLTLRGMDLAAGSAVAAARAVDRAIRSGDTTRAGLASYREDLFRGFAGQDMETFSSAPAFLARPRLYSAYGPLLGDVLYGAFGHDGTPRRRLRTVVRDALRTSPVKLRQVVADAVAGARSL